MDVVKGLKQIMLWKCFLYWKVVHLIVWLLSLFAHSRYAKASRNVFELCLFCKGLMLFLVHLFMVIFLHRYYLHAWSTTPPLVPNMPSLWGELALPYMEQLRFDCHYWSSLFLIMSNPNLLHQICLSLICWPHVLDKVWPNLVFYVQPDYLLCN